MHEPFAELAFLLVVASVVGVIAVHLRQPVLIAYILLGIIVGPAGFSFVQAHDQIDLLAQIGVTVLLFLVGLKLDLQHVRHIGPVALATGLGQLAFTIIFGFLLILFLGKDWITALYVAIALTFSSTIIIVKLLTDKRELDSLHGRIAVGFLIVQDIAVVLAMMVMSTIRGDTQADDLSGWMVAASLIFRIGLTALLMFFLMGYILPTLVRYIARSQELLLIFAIAWGTSLAALGEWAGFSKEAGAFMAGFSLASTHFRDAISARLTGIRDFLLLFFFIDLGAKLDFSVLGAELWPAAALSLFVLIGNPIIVMAIMGYMGYRKRTGLLAGLTVAQISEFSIVFIAMGISLGHLEQDALGLTTLVGVVTIALSTYMILYSQRLYEFLSNWLSIFERARPYREISIEQQNSMSNKGVRIIIFGLGRYGARVMAHLHNHGVGVLGVDFDPEAIRTLKHRNMPVHYGDAEDPAFLSSLPFANVDWIVTTLPEWSANRALLHALKEAGFKGRIVGLVRDDEHVSALQQAGVTRVINIFQEAADHAADYLAREIEIQERRS